MEKIQEYVLCTHVCMVHLLSEMLTEGRLGVKGEGRGGLLVLLWWVAASELRSEDSYQTLTI